MFDSRIQKLNNEIIKLHSTDSTGGLADSTTESSSISEQHFPIIVNRYRNKIIPHYAAKIAALGGVEGALKTLETYLSNQIELIQSNQQSTQACYRYQVALRALTDSHTLGFSSLLHAGSTYHYRDIYVRELLAYYWVAASDSDMVFSVPFATELEQDPTKRDQLLTASKENFVSVLEEIRRAHNENELATNLSEDAPSCPRGTVGRIFIRASIYNQVTAIDHSAFSRIPDDMQNYIISIIESENDETKKVIYTFITDKLLMGETSEELKNKFKSFINRLNNYASTKALLSKLQLTIPSLNINHNRVKEILVQMYFIELNNLLQESENDLPSQKMIDRIRNITSTAVLNDRILTASSREQSIINKRLDVLKLLKIRSDLHKMVENEIMKEHLLSHQSSILSNPERLLDYLNHNIINKTTLEKTKLESELNIITENVKNDVANTDGLDASHYNPIQVLQNQLKIVDVALKKSLELKKVIDSLMTQKGIESSTQTNSHINLLRSLPISSHLSCCHTLTSIAEKWAWNLLRIIVNESSTNNLIRAESDLNEWIISLKEKLIFSDRTKCLSILSRHLTCLNLSEEYMNSINKILYRLFKQHQLMFVNVNESFSSDDLLVNWSNLPLDEDMKSLMYTISEQSLILADTQDGRIVSKDINEAKNKQSQWVNAANNMLASLTDPETKLHCLHQFALLTLFRNLQLTEVRKRDAETIRWICNHYINSDTAAHFEISFERTIHGLANHLACLLTTLNPVADLFNAGFVRLMSREDAEEILQDIFADSTYPGVNQSIFRVSNSRPYQLAISHVDVYRRNYNIISHADIKHKLLTMEFVGDSSCVIIIPKYNTKLSNEVAPTFYFFNRDSIKKLCETANYTPILGVVPFHIATNVSYANQRYDRYFSMFSSDTIDVLHTDYFNRPLTDLSASESATEENKDSHLEKRIKL